MQGPAHTVREAPKIKAHKAMVINALAAPIEFGYGTPKYSTHERTKQQSIELSLVPVAMVVVASLCCLSLSLSGPLSSVLSTFLIVGSSSYSAHSLITIQSAGYSLHLTQHNLISGYIVATTTSRFPCRVLRVL